MASFGGLGGAGGALGAVKALGPSRGVSRAGLAVTQLAGKLTKPGGVGQAGSALLNGASSLTHPTAQGAPAATSTTDAPNPAGGSDLDATYYQNVADNQFKINNQINTLNRTDANNLTALQTALGNLAYQQPRDQLALEQKANAAGGLYSSVEGQRQGDLVHTYEGKRTAAQTSYDTAHTGILDQIAALLGSEPIYDTGQAIDSANRAAALAQKNPASAGAATTTTAGAGTGGGAAPGGHGRVALTSGKRVGQAGSAVAQLGGRLSAKPPKSNPQKTTLSAKTLRVFGGL